MTVKEQQFQNEVILLKQSFHRVSKRLYLVENFIKNKFGNEFAASLRNFSTTRSSAMRINFVRMTEKKRSPSMKVNSNPESALRSRKNTNIPYKTTGDFSSISGGRTTRSKSLSFSVQDSQNLTETEELSQTQRLQVYKQEGTMLGEQRAISLENADDDNVSFNLMDFDAAHPSENSDTEPNDKTGKNVKPSSPEYQPEYDEELDDELDQSDTEFVPYKPKQKTEKSKRGRKPLRTNDFEYPIDKKCPVCGKKFKDTPFWKRAIRDHIEDHTAPNSFACDQCSKSYKREKRLNYHKKLCHNQETFRFKCNWCDKKFLQLSYRAKHELFHTKERSFMCDICGNSYGQQSALKIHRMKHSSTKDVLCNQCGKAFMTVYCLSKHKKQVHEYTYDEDGNIISDKPCHICDRKYTTNVKLKDHIMRMHEGRRKKIRKPHSVKTSGPDLDPMTCTSSSPLHAVITPPTNLMTTID